MRQYTCLFVRLCAFAAFLYIYTMFANLFNRRTWLTVIAVLIVTGTIFYSNFLAKKIARDEKQKIEQWVEAFKEINNPSNNSVNLSSKILIENSRNIPMIAVTEKDSIFDHYNLDSIQSKTNPDYLKNKLKKFKALHEPIEWRNPLDTTQINRVYYGESSLLKQVRYYPLIQLLIVALFIIVTLIMISTQNKSTQNQVWAGMAKETAHQLGTPLSSLEGWVEMLKENSSAATIAGEITKDVNRLKLVSERFGKIGSTPSLEERNLVRQITEMVAYMKRRATDKVTIHIDSNGKDNIPAVISAPLFDWVMENLLKNALDAMEGKGSINILIKSEAAQTIIDVTDSGKGISKNNLGKVFNPGFTTKKRGWGLGLTLTKRIICDYHKGEIFVKHSEPGKGTTFRIILKK